MKISSHHTDVHPDAELLACFDVSKASLTLFTRFEQNDRTYGIEDAIANSTDAIEHLLTRLSGIAHEADRKHLRVLCEPTGGFEQKLLATARRLGHRTALISSEHVAQLKKVESNDTGKTDQKDPEGSPGHASGGAPGQDAEASPPPRTLPPAAPPYRILQR